MLSWYVVQPPLYPCVCVGVQLVYIYAHIGVGFCVVSFSVVGNAKALSCGMGNGYRFPRLNQYMFCKYL